MDTHPEPGMQEDIATATSAQQECAAVAPYTSAPNPVSLEEIQSRIDRWIRTIGVTYFSELTNLAVLMEEVGELARLMARTYGDQSFKKSDFKGELADEMADVLFVLVCLANQTGVDLTKAIEANLAKKTERDADRHRNNPKLSGSA
jgi:NTP pyrophosphatase (non-canonical NTP hydrolase)